MADKKTLSLRSPRRIDTKAAQDFINEPDKKTVTKKRSPYPWDASDVTDEIIKQYPLRLTKPDKLKAEFIVKQSSDYKSLQDFFAKAIKAQISNDLELLNIK